MLLSISPFVFVNICFMHLSDPMLGAYTFTIFILLVGLIPFSLCNVLLCLYLWFKSTLSDICIVTPAFFSFPFEWNTFYTPSLSVYVYLYKWSEYLVGSVYVYIYMYIHIHTHTHTHTHISFLKHSLEGAIRNHMYTEKGPCEDVAEGSHLQAKERPQKKPNMQLPEFWTCCLGGSHMN